MGELSIYRSWSPDQLDNLMSNYLVDSWSYSKLNQFSRNEKAFEMIHIYGQRSKSSASSVSGNAYHFALDRYFTAWHEAKRFDIADLEMFAFDYIDERPAYIWKIQKTNPTVEDCKKKATTVSASLLKNFFAELTTYEDQIAEVLYVEIYCDEFLTVNGVDIPLPCHAKIDLVIRTHDGRVVIIDHKSKAAFSDEQAVKLAIGVQAMTYVSCFEAKTGEAVDEVWFIENKYSKNKDNSPQMIKYPVIMDKDTRRLYEAILYEPLKRMISAVSDPDYVYLINDSDNFVDKAELYDFWCKTMIAEVEDFNVRDDKKEMVAKRLKKIRDASLGSISPKVIKEFKMSASAFIQYDLSDKNMTPQEKIEHVLRSFGTIVKVAHQFDGYSSNTYLLEVSAGVKIASIHNHKLDIANQLNVSNVRILKDLTVYDGKSYLSVEFSKNRDRDLPFTLSDMVNRKIPIGKDNYGNVVFWDLDNHSTPHALVCGATGSGKSVSVKSTIEYALEGAADIIIILDPKYEFTSYKTNPRVKVYQEIIEIEEAMIDLVDMMNEMVKSGQKRNILVIFDEFADAVASSRKGKELILRELQEIGSYANGGAKMGMVTIGELKPLEENLRVILQKGRSSGIRVMAATQRASVKVITGDAKANFPVVICYYVPKAVDSIVVLDEAGAESLSGRGDGLIKSPEYKDTVRFQAYYHS
jgi:S-DNA-T family DNA segregation ATPase FtsK/SpoIIIE